MSMSPGFTGSINLTVIEASDLQPILLPGGRKLDKMDPYAVIDFDEIYFGSTTSKTRTSSPYWMEEFAEDVHDATLLGVTIFHKSIVPPDPFIAHVQVPLDQLTEGQDTKTQSFDGHHFEYVVCQEIETTINTLSSLFYLVGLGSCRKGKNKSTVQRKIFR